MAKKKQSESVYRIIDVVCTPFDRTGSWLR